VSAVLADLSGIRTWADLASHLNNINNEIGKSLNDLQRIAKVNLKANPRLRELPTSTVSDALNGRRPIKMDLLESLLAAWHVPSQERERFLETWRRINAAVGQGPANAGRFDEASPRELGVHPAISIHGATDDLPGYVERDFDERLHELIARGSERGCFVLLLGKSSCGKTRSLYEAVRAIVPEWWLVQPARVQDIHDHLARPTDRTVLWLDELHRYLGADPPLRKTDVVALVRAGTIVVGTLWPNYYFARKQLLQGEAGDVYAEDRRLLELADVINVSDAFSVQEQQRASRLAATDTRIEAALEVSDTGLTQVLAAGPDLVNSWEQAPDPYARAILTAAVDARRLGVQCPLSTELLTAAMAGYLTSAQRVASPEYWTQQALLHATNMLHGAVSALTPVAGITAGSVEGYVVADYLTQHISSVRRVECPPDSLWTALVTHLHDPDDLRRMASAALVRMRYGYAERALSRLHEAGDPAAVLELVTLLRRQDRLSEAMCLIEAWSGAAPGDRRRREVRSEFIDLQARAELLRQLAELDPAAEELLYELLDDGGQAARLRDRAAAGDAVAADDLVDLLVDRGCLDELRERANGGHRFATERLADLLASLRRKDELQQRAADGDIVAALHLERLESVSRPSEADLAWLRTTADSGDEDAAIELTLMLFDNGDLDVLLAEVNAGTYLAAERYLALLAAGAATDRRLVWRVRRLGLRADGLPGTTG